MGFYRRLTELRHEQIVGHARPDLDADERVLRWTRARDPERRGGGFVYVTSRRLIVVMPGRKAVRFATAWDDIERWEVDSAGRDGPLLHVRGNGADVTVRLSVGTRGLAVHATELVREVATRAPSGSAAASERVTLERARRSLGAHTRRVVTSIAGGALVLVGLVLSAPGVPGPGLLTVAAGLGILATEYDWAQDAQHWALAKARAVTHKLKKGDTKDTA